jgi:hypothetical protein
MTDPVTDTITNIGLGITYELVQVPIWPISGHKSRLSQWLTDDDSEVDDGDDE